MAQAILAAFAVSLALLSIIGNRRTFVRAFAGFPIDRREREPDVARGSNFFLGNIIGAVLKPVTTILGGRYEKDVAKKQQETAQNVAKEETKQKELEAFAQVAQAQLASAGSSDMKKYLIFGGIGIAVLLIVILLMRK